MGGPVVVDSYPASNATDVPRLFEARVVIDRRLLPGSVHRGSVRIESGGVQVLLAIRFDPVDGVILARPFDGVPLERDVRYRLIVEQIDDLEGGTMSEPFVATFQTGNTMGALDPLPGAAYADVEPIFRGRCTGSGCHGPDLPASGLDLSSAEGIAWTALGRLTLGRGAGTSSRLATLPIVDRIASTGRPSHSYLLYKVLADPHVAGDPMPPSQLTDPSAALSDDEVRTLSAWILAGSPTVVASTAPTD